MKRISAFILSALLIFSLSACGVKPTESLPELSAAAKKISAVFMDDDPGLGSEWLAMAFYHNDFGQKSGWQKKYLQKLESELHALDGIPGRKSTDYASVVLGVTAAGGDARNIGGYDLTEKLNDAEFVKKQGVSGTAYALLALDSGGYGSGLREEYISFMLSRQLQDGGFALTGEHADPDVTAMVIQALSAYTDRPEAAAAINAALSALSSLQRENGGYASWGTVNSESSAQVVLALCSMKIPLDDERFCKNGFSVTDDLLSYRTETGEFSHVPDGEASPMAGVQALLALSAALRMESGERPFDFTA